MMELPETVPASTVSLLMEERTVWTVPKDSTVLNARMNALETAMTEEPAMMDWMETELVTVSLAGEEMTVRLVTTDIMVRLVSIPARKLVLIEVLAPADSLVMEPACPVERSLSEMSVKAALITELETTAMNATLDCTEPSVIRHAPSHVYTMATVTKVPLVLEDALVRPDGPEVNAKMWTMALLKQWE